MEGWQLKIRASSNFVSYLPHFHYPSPNSDMNISFITECSIRLEFWKGGTERHLEKLHLEELHMSGSQSWLHVRILWWTWIFLTPGPFPRWSKSESLGWVQGWGVLCRTASAQAILLFYLGLMTVCPLSEGTNPSCGHGHTRRRSLLAACKQKN